MSGAASRAGIGMVHQELAFCPNLSVAENLFLGDPPARYGIVRRREMARAARGHLRDVGLDIDPWTPIDELSTAQEQLVQIAAAVARQSRIIIMDEPTSSLSPAESRTLLCGQMLTVGYRAPQQTIVSHTLRALERWIRDQITVRRDRKKPD